MIALSSQHTLVLSGVRLIFFSVAGMGLCFRTICVEHRVDNTKKFLLLLSISYTEPRHFMAFFAAHTLLLARELWLCRKLGGDTAGTVSPTEQRHIPYHMLTT